MYTTNPRDQVLARGESSLPPVLAIVTDAGNSSREQVRRGPRPSDLPLLAPVRATWASTLMICCGLDTKTALKAVQNRLLARA